MSLYKEFSQLLPHIQSVRKLDNYLVFDVSFPDTWKLPKKYVIEERFIEQPSQLSGYKSFSFVSELIENEVELISNNIQNIIKYNLDREEKQKLFENKVNELRSIFEKQNLKNLKGLKFEIKNNKLEFDSTDGQDEITELVGKNGDEGQNRG
jgi:hypothetical protein